MEFEKPNHLKMLSTEELLRLLKQVHEEIEASMELEEPINLKSLSTERLLRLMKQVSQEIVARERDK
jgi:hypothetical protein